MIISKTPFRVSLFGGSTDYESFYSKHGSLLIGFGINKYCYTSVRETPSIFDYLTRISYSKVEIVNEQGEITDILKASTLSSESDLLFIRNSLSGSIQCRPNKNIAKLNEELHSND